MKATLKCIRFIFCFVEGWEVIWHPEDINNHRGAFTVTIKYHHPNGGDSCSYKYVGPPSLRSSLHLIKTAIKDGNLPK